MTAISCRPLISYISYCKREHCAERQDASEVFSGTSPGNRDRNFIPPMRGPSSKSNLLSAISKLYPLGLAHAGS